MLHAAKLAAGALVAVFAGTGAALAQPVAVPLPPGCSADVYRDPIFIAERAPQPGAIVGGEAAAQDAATALACAEAGLAAAQWNLGRMYINGWGVGLDLAAAESWYRRAAEQGYANAEVSLGVLLTQNEPTDAELVEALTWFLAGAAKGIPYAMLRLAEAYTNGTGTPVDLVQAAKWYIVATGFNEEGAFQPLADLRASMQRPAFADAQARADAWADAWNAGRPMEGL